jgi:putative hydrolase of the HAD superfamily
MIKNIIFDMGQVLIHWRPFMFVQGFGLSQEEEQLLTKEVFTNIEWPQLDRGTISDEEAILSINKRLPEKFHPFVEEIITGWWKRPLVPMEGMEAIVKELKENGYRIYLLSNASLWLRTYFDRIPGSQYFDGHIVSSEHKLLKPQHEIYEKLFERYNLIPEECFFIDDSPYNIEGAYMCGMPGAVFHGDVEELRYNLQNAGIKIM